MDYINRVELAGTVGACRLTQAGGQTVARMSVATTIVYRDSAGEQVLETTWHSVVAWQKPGHYITAVRHTGDFPEYTPGGIGRCPFDCRGPATVSESVIRECPHHHGPGLV